VIIELFLTKNRSKVADSYSMRSYRQRELGCRESSSQVMMCASWPLTLGRDHHGFWCWCCHGYCFCCCRPIIWRRRYLNSHGLKPNSCFLWSSSISVIFAP